MSKTIARRFDFTCDVDYWLQDPQRIRLMREFLHMLPIPQYGLMPFSCLASDVTVNVEVLAAIATFFPIFEPHLQHLTVPKLWVYLRCDDLTSDFLYQRRCSTQCKKRKIEEDDFPKLSSCPFYWQPIGNRWNTHQGTGFTLLADDRPTYFQGQRACNGRAVSSSRTSLLRSKHTSFLSWRKNLSIALGEERRYFHFRIIEHQFPFLVLRALDRMPDLKHIFVWQPFEPNKLDAGCKKRKDPLQHILLQQSPLSTKFVRLLDIQVTDPEESEEWEGTTK